MISKKSKIKVLLLAALTLVYAGCSTHEAHQSKVPEDQYLPRGEAAPPPPPAPEPVAFDDGYDTVTIAYPTGIEATSNILITKRFPRQVLRGQEYEYTIEVTNLTDLDLENVNVIETFPKGFEIISTNPDIYDTSGDRVAWALGKLEKRGSRTITVRGKANTSGSVPCCTEANFRIPALCLNTDVIDPGLQLTVRAPANRLACESIPLTYTVKNSGESIMKDVTVVGKLPRNIVSSDGNNSLNVAVGSLSPGEEKTIETVVNATSTGDYTFAGTANGIPSIMMMGGIQGSNIAVDADSVVTRVSKPSLSVSATPTKGRQFVGRAIGFDIDVVNNGNTTSDNTVVVASVPSGTSFKAASEGGSFNGSTSTVSWNVGNLPAGASKRLGLTLGTQLAGTATVRAEASGICADMVTASASTPLTGVSALLLEMVDVTDPLEVGDSTVYQIRVTNQGNAEATNIRLVGDYEDMAYVNSGGHTPITQSGKNLSFGSFSLAAKASASWQITLKATGVGDQRFHLEMNSDQLQRPVNETESTTVY